MGIYSTKNSGGYLTKDGISYSARYVSAAAALLRAKYPSESAGQIIARLISTADRTDSMHGRDDRFGYGIVDPLKALQAPEPVSRANPLLNASGGSTSKAARQSTAMPWALAGIAAGTASVAVAGGFAVFRRRRSRTT
ncbi:S8 family serine peptidase [Actinacidiphila oryziradicis]|uniref:S8 family serine peptidase n=1 Tax=Actinacidiphila oryziradicis TaxID=2571141 RepID=UPI0023F15944|nr:S8 family serine peptidase [Actinacidiphila oryziradicis]